MTSINVHIYPSSFKNESRIEKQANSINKLTFFSSILLIGMGKNRNPKALVSGIPIILLGEENTPASSIIKIKRFLSWYVDVYKFLKNKHKRNNITCINAHSLSVLPLCLMMKKITKAKLIYDTHELETETNGSHGIRKILSKLLERVLIKHVDHTFVVSKSISKHYIELYQLKNINTVLNAPTIMANQRKDIFREKLNINSSNIIFLYQGVLSHGRGIEVLLKTFSELDDKSACIVFMGYGPLVEKVIECQTNSTNIFYYPAVSPNQVHEHTSSADIGIALIQNTCLSYKYCMPNKLFEYGMASLPCIVSPLVEMEKYVTENECGFVLEDYTTLSLEKLIITACNADLIQMRINARNAAVENSWEQQESLMLSVYKNILGVTE